jgi:hypothetical protein
MQLNRLSPSPISRRTLLKRMLSLGARGFLSVGHEEYYRLEMFKNLQAAVARGAQRGILLRQHLLWANPTCA